MSKKTTEISTVMHSIVDNKVDLTGLASIAVAEHEAKLEAMEVNLKDDISDIRSSILKNEESSNKLIDSEMTKAGKSLKLQPLVKSMETLVECEVDLTFKPDGIDVEKNKVYFKVVLSQKSSADELFHVTKSFDLPKEYLKIQATIDNLNKLQVEKTNLLADLRREQRDISKLERRAQARVAAFTLGKVEGAEDLLADLRTGLLGKSSVLELKA